MMDCTFQLELFDTIKKLSKKLKELKIHHDYLNNIHHKLSNLVSSENVSNDSDGCSFYESDNTLSINYLSAASGSSDSEIFSDALDYICPDLKIVNCNCSENFQFAEEKFHYVKDEETFETPFFKLKNINCISDEQIKHLKDFVVLLEAITLFNEPELHDSIIIKCSLFEEYHYPTILYFNFTHSSSHKYYYYHYIFTLDQVTVANFHFRRVETYTNDIIETEHERTDHCYLMSIYTILNDTLLFNVENDGKSDVAEIYFKSSNLFYSCTGTVENYMAHATRYSDLSKVTLTINHSYLSCQRYQSTIYVVGVKKRIKSFKISQQIFTPHDLNLLDNFSAQTLLLPLKRSYFEYNQYFIGNKNTRDGDVFCKDFILKERDKYDSSLLLKNPKPTFSEKRWHIILRTSIQAIYRKIISEMFFSDTYQKQPIISREALDDLTISLHDTSHPQKVKTDEHVKSEEVSHSHAGGLIRLKSIDILQDKMNCLNLTMSQLPSCKNVFDIKRALKDNLMKNNLKMVEERSYFSENCSENMTESDDEIVKCRKCALIVDTKSDSSDTVMCSRESSLTIIERDLKTKESKSNSCDKSEMDCENISIDKCSSKQNSVKMFPRSRQTGHESLKKCFSSLTNRPTIIEMRNNEATSEVTVMSDIDSLSSDLKISKSYSSTYSHKRCCKTSTETLHSILNDNSENDEYLKCKSLREKAVTCILNAKNNISSSQQRCFRVTGRIDKLIENHQVTVKKKYRCSQCCKLFQLATELRQHKRDHKCQLKSPAN